MSRENSQAVESPLPLADLLELLQEQQKVGSLHARLSSFSRQKRTIRGRFIAQVDFDFQNQTTSFLIAQETGQVLLKGDQAWDALKRLQDATWSVTIGQHGELPTSSPTMLQLLRPDILPTSRRNVSLSFSQRTPHRSRELTTQQLRSLTRELRTVFLLVDGRRKTQEIAVLLPFMNAEEVENLLRELTSQLLIRFD